MAFKDERKHRYSWSGSDARPFAYFPDSPELIAPLESLHTLSVSVHEGKGQARALGYRGIKGIASAGIRTIAGSMIFTIVEDHPLRPIYNQLEQTGLGSGGWSLDRHLLGTGTAFDVYDYTHRMVTLLPPFNLLLQYAAEAGHELSGKNPDISARIPGGSFLLCGIEFIDAGIVTSTSDIVTEMSMTFIAYDYKELSSVLIGGTVSDELFEELAAEFAAEKAAQVEAASYEERLVERLLLSKGKAASVAGVGNIVMSKAPPL